MKTCTRTKFTAFTLLLTIAVFGGTATTRGAGKYLKIDYPASTNAGELQTPVTYTLWIPDGVKTLRGHIVHQHGAGNRTEIALQRILQNVSNAV